MTINGSSQRDELVFTSAQKHNIPIMVSTGGGYSQDINEIVEAHCNTFRRAFKVFNW